MKYDLTPNELASRIGMFFAGETPEGMAEQTPKVAEFIKKRDAAIAAKGIPDVVTRALKLMAEERMAVGFDEREVRKCCESDPKSPHDSDCLIFHALDSLGLVKPEGS